MKSVAGSVIKVEGTATAEDLRGQRCVGFLFLSSSHFTCESAEFKKHKRETTPGSRGAATVHRLDSKSV